MQVAGGNLHFSKVEDSLRAMPHTGVTKPKYHYLDYLSLP